MIRLYGSAMSGNAHKVRMALAFLGLDWHDEVADAATRQS